MVLQPLPSNLPGLSPPSYMQIQCLVIGSLSEVILHLQQMPSETLPHLLPHPEPSTQGNPKLALLPWT